MLAFGATAISAPKVRSLKTIVHANLCVEVLIIREPVPNAAYVYPHALPGGTLRFMVTHPPTASFITVDLDNLCGRSYWHEALFRRPAHEDRKSGPRRRKYV